MTRNLFGLIALFAFPVAANAQSNIDAQHKLAWCENIGWTNWLDAGGSADGVFVSATFLSGKIWSENTGWLNVGNGAGPYLNTDGTDFGVNILASGDLDGFAWSENVGWVNFGWAATANPDRPRFDRVGGRFRGWAWAENVGWINLDDVDHFVGANTCTANADCNDTNVCSFDECLTGACSHSPNLYGNVDFNDIVNIFDLFCVLDGFGGTFAGNCTLERMDVEPCAGNGTIDIFDLFAVLNAFSGTDPCCGGLP